MNIDFNEENNSLKIYLSKDIDSNVCKNMKNILDGYIIKYQPRNIYLDLHDVNFMDSSGIGLLMGRYKFAKMINSNLYILNPNPKIKKIMEVSNMKEIIEIVEE